MGSSVDGWQLWDVWMIPTALPSSAAAAMLCSACHGEAWQIMDEWASSVLSSPLVAAMLETGRTGMTEGSASLQWSVLPPGCLSATWKDQNIDMYTIKSSLRNTKEKLYKYPWTVCSNVR